MEKLLELGFDEEFDSAPGGKIVTKILKYTFVLFSPVVTIL